MLILKPVSIYRVWGTSALYDYCGDKSIDKIGGIYSVSSTKEICCTIINKEYESMRLDEFVKKFSQKLGLKPNENYPIIIAITGSTDNCSIQIHPTDEYAKIHEKLPYGKDESWFIINPPYENFAYAQAKCKDKDEIRRLAKLGEYEKIVDKIYVKKGDVVYIPSGTVHALTKGALIYEIQQYTDITYRFFDYFRLDKSGNPRKLQLDEAIETLNVNNKVQISTLDYNNTHETKAYNLNRKIINNKYKNNADIACAITVLNGSAKIEGYSLKKGMSFLIFPDEEIISSDSLDVIIATPKRYWEKQG